jgi:hypothetical protein
LPVDRQASAKRILKANHKWCSLIIKAVKRFSLGRDIKGLRPVEICDKENQRARP